MQKTVQQKVFEKKKINLRETVCFYMERICVCQEHFPIAF